MRVKEEHLQQWVNYYIRPNDKFFTKILNRRKKLAYSFTVLLT